MKSAFSKCSEEINVLRSAFTISGPRKSDGVPCKRPLCEAPAGCQPSVRAAIAGLGCSLAVSGRLAASWLPSPPRPERCVFPSLSLPPAVGGRLCFVSQCGAQTRTAQTAQKTARINKELLFQLIHARVRVPGGDGQHLVIIPIAHSCTPAPAPAAGASSCPALPAVPCTHKCGQGLKSLM